MEPARGILIMTAVLGLGAIPHRSQATPTSASYTVTVLRNEPQNVHVAGTFALESSMIGMYLTSSPQLEDGQAALIRNLYASSLP